MFMNEDQKIVVSYNQAVVANEQEVTAACKQLREEGVIPSLKSFVPPSNASAYMASQRELQRKAAAR